MLIILSPVSKPGYVCIVLLNMIQSHLNAWNIDWALRESEYSHRRKIVIFWPRAPKTWTQKSVLVFGIWNVIIVIPINEKGFVCL